LSIAEIIEESDKVHQEISEVETEPMLSEEPEIKIYPEFNAENTSKAFEIFAARQKVSIISLIKLLIPAIEGRTVIVTLTRQQEEFIGDIKIQWQAFLREYFNLQNIVLQIRIDDQANTKIKAYTQAEQFQEMLDEHETFRLLVTRLKLKLK
jgi:hypothetical protein